jgi:hypothetical protein
MQWAWKSRMTQAAPVAAAQRAMVVRRSQFALHDLTEMLGEFLQVLVA